MMDYLDYPVVTEHELPTVPRRGAFNLGRRVRPTADIPPILAGQVRVYRVGSEYVLDRGQLAADSDEVIEATHVSVVDTRTNRSIPVTVPLASAEGRDFTAVVSFACTVSEPVTVVRDGTVNAQQQLFSHLKSHRPIFELGSKRRFDEIDNVRRAVHAEVTAFITLVPPEIDGMTVRLLGTEVLTPDEWAAAAAQIADEHRGQTITTLKATHEHDLKDLDAQRGFVRDQNLAMGDVEIAVIRARGDLDVAGMQTDSDIDLSARRLQEELAENSRRAESEDTIAARRLDAKLDNETRRSRHDLQLTADRIRADLAIESWRADSELDLNAKRIRAELKQADLQLKRHLKQMAKMRSELKSGQDANVWTYLTRERSAEDLTAGFDKDRDMEYGDRHVEREYVRAERRERQAGMRDILQIMYKLGALENLEADASRLLHELAFGELPATRPSAVLGYGETSTAESGGTPPSKDNTQADTAGGTHGDDGDSGPREEND